METFSDYDVGGFQICSNFEENSQGTPCDDAAVCVKIIENADQVSGQAVEEIKYENYECNISESSSSVKRRLGIWQ